MAIKFVEAGRTFIPDAIIPTDNLGDINNRDLPDNEKIICDVELSTIEEKARYLGNYSITTDEGTKEYSTFRFRECVIEKCKKIDGLKEAGVSDGKTLYDASKKYQWMGAIIREIFWKVNGIHPDDISEKSDSGQLKEGE